MLDSAVRNTGGFPWSSQSSFRNIPSRIIHTTTRIFLRHIHLTAALLSLALIFGGWHLFMVLSLGHDSPVAFPRPRAFFVSTLVAVPIWGFCMCTCYILWTYRTQPLWNYLFSRRHRSDQYTLLGHDLDDSPENIRAASSSSHEVERKDLSAPEWNLALFTLWLGYLSLGLFGFYMFCTYELPIDHRFKTAVDLARREPKREGYGTGEKVFIAAMFYNNAKVVPYWTTEISKLIHYLGPENVFVSIVESYSSDATPALLRAFERNLDVMGVSRRIITQDTSIPRPASMGTAPPRIEYLAAVRNLVLEPLVAEGGYDRVVFSNDVFVEAESIVELLNTKDGDYDMACALDFAHFGLYDLWVIRDRLGRLVSGLWPYFFEDSGFRAVMADEPAPVFACWNGIVSMRADPFLPVPLRRGQLSNTPLPRPLPATHPAYPQVENLTPAGTPPLRFRASAPSECFSSESFNVPYDFRRQFALSKIYANPCIITAYRWKYYLWFKYATRHWAVRWFIENVENGAGMHLAKIVLGDPKEIWQWDGGECHPGPW